MTTKNQITLIKLAFLIVIIGSIIFRLDVFQEGFEEGWNGTDTTPSFSEGLIAFTAAYFGIKILINLFRFINSVQKEDIFEKKEYSPPNFNGLVLYNAFYFAISFLFFKNKPQLFYRFSLSSN